MPDREKVIRELKAARLFFEMGSNRAGGVVGNLGCKSGMKYIEDALELLEEQETTSTAESRLFHCEKCGYGIDDIYLSNEYDFDIDPHYCPNCGRKVKWE